MSPHGVRLSGAPGAPFCIGCSSANRALAGKLLWDGIVAVPKVFGAGCPVILSTEQPSAEEHGQPGGSAHSGDAGERVQPPGRSPAHLPNLRTQGLRKQGDAWRNAKRCGIRGHSAAIRAARINSGPKGGRCTGSTGLAGSPRRPRIMEGPLVSDTTELLSGAPGASEDAPVGTSAPSAASGASTTKSRSRGGTGLSSLLMPELQRIAQSMGIPGAGRMRKGQLVEAIEARQGGAPKQEAGAANQGSNQRVASAGADSTRLRKQDAMDPDTRTQSGIGDGAVTGIGADPFRARRDRRGGGRGAGQQLSFDQAPAAEPLERPDPAGPDPAGRRPADPGPGGPGPAGRPSRPRLSRLSRPPRQGQAQPGSRRDGWRGAGRPRGRPAGSAGRGRGGRDAAR